ncbi:MAG: hypothetical protein NXH95_00560 [Pseudomonadaceae bacterium]|nr:hypothetical protein [Pseudomonadaceae bacterium]
MMRCAFLLFVTLSFALGAGSASAKLQDDMDEAEFRAAGLHKLSTAELAALNRWLNKAPQEPKAAPRAAQAPATQAAPEVTEFGQEQLEVPVAAEVPIAIRAHIKGEFRGWDGKSIFRLDNGQVWQQRVGSRYRGPKMTDPEVEITKGRFGYYLKVLSSNRSVGVKRIQ